jgi:pSer/pThr/pTyr-binding forkhead associated (FHA) protein
VRLAAGRTTQLGRDPAVSPVASACGDNVSRFHAELRAGADGLVVVDVGSVNGTWVNGQALTRGQDHALQAGDVVQLGQDPPVRLVVVEVEG